MTLYDGSGSVGSVPGPGDVTATRQADSYDGDAPHYVTTSTTSSRDVHGRALVTADALGRVTTTAYTPATGAAPTSMTVTDPLKHTTTSVFDPRRGLMTRATTPAGLVTSWSYDGLGRVVGVWKPGQTQGVTPAGIVYEYAISASAPTTVTTKALTDGGGYRKAVTLYDALLRKRQDQTETVDGGRTVTDTVYDSHGWVVKTSDAYYTTGAPATTIAEAVDGEVPSQTGILYDAAGRRTAEIAHRYGGETWRTSYRYGGDFTTTVPPEGGTATTTLVDARGRTTALLQHHSRDNTGLVGTGDYDRTGYAYTPDGRRAGITDAAGNVWSFSYDLLGREVRKVDPDVGTTTSRYDAAGQLLSTTDARGRTVSTSYDAGGRRTAEYDTTGDREQSAENRIASWTYDTLKKGLLTSSSSYVDGAAYTTTTLGYDSAGRAKGSRLTLPTGEGKLAPSGGYVTEYTYTPTGMVESETTGAAAGLAQEKVNYGYDALGRITSVKGIWTYLDNLAYTPFDEPAVYTMPTVGGGNVWYGLSYDEQTRRLTDTVLKASDTSTEVDHTRYAYDHDGSVTRIATTRDATATDTQCFRYDHAARLSSAWTATDGCAATPETGDSGTVGGPDVYWQSWTYDVVGNRLTQTDHATGAVTRGDTTTSYSYPEAGKDAERPHALTGTGTRTGPDGQETETSRDYDAAGNTTRIATPHGTQALTWDAKGRLDTDTVTGTDEAGQVRNVYDAKGDLLLRKGPRTSTLYLGNGQVALDARTGALSATRYYRAGATTIAARTSDGHVTFLLPDRQGSDTVAVDSQTQAVRRRSYTPFGEERAATPAEWPGDRGYVGGSADPVTDLVHLGAREYDPATGRFLSGDPLLDPEDPQQLGGYAYSANTPVTKSDPTGLAPGYGDALGYGDYYAHRAWEAQMRYGGFVGPLDPSTDWGNSHAAAPGSPWTPKVTPAPSGLDKPICKAPPKPKKKRGIWGSIKKWTNDHMDEVITAVQIAAAVATVAMIVVPGLNLIALAFYATQALTWAAVAASAVQVGMDVAKGESAAKTAWDATGLIGGGLGKGAGLTARAMARTAKGASSLSGASARLSQGFADLGVRGGRAASAARKCSAGLAAQAKQVKPHIAAFEGVAASATKAENALEGVGLWMASVDGFQAMDKYFG
ncbi:MAG: RHS repeat-associated core domain-containing protein [Actinomycetales bacterium]|nr:RHS repeat-associated core domain-containing protein [Actinomycetales bacterium]